jgi:hypothetical protein
MMLTHALWFGRFSDLSVHRSRRAGSSAQQAHQHGLAFGQPVMRVTLDPLEVDAVRRWPLIIAALMLLGLLLVACGSPAVTPSPSGSPAVSPSPSGPTPLLTPNGRPKNEGLHGDSVPGVIWFQGHAYRNLGIIAHLEAHGQRRPLPAFLSPVGKARMAVGMGTKSSPYSPDDQGSAFPVYARTGTPAGTVLVAEFDLVGSRAWYTLYWEFHRV